MTTFWKLTDPDGQTWGGMQWGPGVTHEADPTLPPHLCTAGVIHAYRSPLLAVFMDPVQGKYWPDVPLWRAEGEVVADDGTQVGCRSLTTVEEVPLPVIRTEQRVRFGILAAKAAPDWPGKPEWIAWADAWLDGTDRSVDAAEGAAIAMARAGHEAEEQAAWAAAEEGTWARVEAAGWAAEVAARAGVDLLPIAEAAVR